MPKQERIVDDKKFLILDFDYVYGLCKRLYDQVVNDNYHPNVILCITDGANHAGRLLRNYFRTPMAYMEAKSYNGMEQGELFIGKSCLGSIKGNVLVLDDLVETALTMSKIEQEVIKKKNVNEARSAVLLNKTKMGKKGNYNPYYLVEKTDADWVVFYYEEEYLDPRINPGIDPKLVPSWINKQQFL